MQDKRKRTFFFVPERSEGVGMRKKIAGRGFSKNGTDNGVTEALELN